MIMIKPEIKIQTVASSEIRIYHLTTKISECPICHFWRPFPKSEYFEQVGELGTSLLHQIFAIPGVREVFIKPDKLQVIKSGIFKWDKIEPDLLEALKKCFGGVEQEVIVTHYTPHDVSSACSDFGVNEDDDRIPSDFNDKYEA